MSRLSRTLACFAAGLLLAIGLTTPTLAQEATLSEKIVAMEQRLEAEFETHFGSDLATVTQGPDAIAATLAQVGAATSSTPAVLWAIPRATHLHLVLITPNGEPVVRDLYDVPKERLEQVVQRFHRQISRPSGLAYQAPATQLYDWLIGTLEAEFLEPAGVDTLLVCMGDGLRGLALPALYDGSQFLVEKYSLSRIPAFNLIDTDYEAIEPGSVLAMGASEFEELEPLPAVPVELQTIDWQLRSAQSNQRQWQSRSVLNQAFTLNNFNTLLGHQPYDIVHLATHAEFRPGAPQDSYIQLWDSRLTLDQMRNLNWQLPSLELLVLSACETAVGDSSAELGFAGLALNAGAKSAVASLWDVSDAGTLALMAEFYGQIAQGLPKAEALGRAQMRLLQGEASPALARLSKQAEVTDFSHPFYWAGFSLISSPW